MRIKQITWQIRRDFQAVFVCPFCGYEETHSGYDDAYFHHNVIPAMACRRCGKSELDGSKNYRPLTTKYEEHEQI